VNVGAVKTVDVATGGHPEVALAAALSRWNLGRPCVVDVGVHHDDGCPCVNGRPMRFCTCEVVRVEGRRVA
jgi:hypothetical protein